ncbi:hypothetical protein [Fusobacterium varium]|uniref:hypothetical protein n=1 Tax=Fusobacterium varium TaxID=856 RepID=UPI0022E0C83B|nr:hypothetical protein [Fusobacterium varium]
MKKKNYKKLQKRMQKNKEILNKKIYPEICSLTGCKYWGKIDEKVCYSLSPAYYAFTYPTFDEEEQAFYHEVYDLDEDICDGLDYLCDIEEVMQFKEWKEIKKEFRLKVKLSKRGQICKVKQRKY